MSNDAEVRAREDVWPAMNAAYDAAVNDNPRLLECGLSNDELREAFMVGLIAARHRLAAEARSHDGEWEAIETAPHACHVIAVRFDHDAGEWIYAFVKSPPSKPFTHWRMPPEPPVSAVPLFDEGPK